MNKKIKRRVNDGNLTGLKQDRFRNSSFELDVEKKSDYFSGVTLKSINTIGGNHAENRGRRNADDSIGREDNPFENGKLYNWNHRQGWDKFFDSSFDKEANRPHGGALIGHDPGGNGMKGPRGYKRSDKYIYTDVCEMLTLNPYVDASDIEVSIKEGVVLLYGHVENQEAKKMAEVAVENISGVIDVQNRLSID